MATYAHLIWDSDSAKLAKDKIDKIKRGKTAAFEITDKQVFNSALVPLCEYLVSAKCGCDSLKFKKTKFDSAGFGQLALALAENRSVHSFSYTYNMVGEQAPEDPDDKDDIDNHIETAVLTNLNYAVYGDAAIKFANALRKNTTLTSVELDENNLGNPGMKVIAEALEVNSTLRHVRIAANGVGDDGFERLAGALKVNSALVTLDVDENLLTNAGLQVLVEVVGANRTLRKLSLRANRISGAGAVHIARTLALNPTLEVLNLRRNELKDDGACTIAEGLEANIGLRELHLSSNLIASAGCARLAQALERNDTLKEMFLDINNIEDAGAERFAQMLQKNTRLWRVDLMMNDFTEAGVRHLCEAVERNSTLAELHLSDSLVGARVPAARIRTKLPLKRGQAPPLPVHSRAAEARPGAVPTPPTEGGPGSPASFPSPAKTAEEANS